MRAGPAVLAGTSMREAGSGQAETWRAAVGEVACALDRLGRMRQWLWWGSVGPHEVPSRPCDSARSRRACHPGTRRSVQR